MDSLVLLLAFSLLEGYLLQRSVFLDVAFRTLCLSSFGLNLVLLGIWNILIYPLFVTPLRHLPTLGVSPFLLELQRPMLVNSKDRVTLPTPVSSSTTPAVACRCNG